MFKLQVLILSSADDHPYRQPAFAPSRRTLPGRRHHRSASERKDHARARGVPADVVVNLEAPDARRLAQADPRGFLAQFPDGVILDEFQRTPELVSYIQVLADEDPRPGRFVLTGSQQLDVMSRVSQSLAGWIGVIRLLPFSFEELRTGGARTGDAAQWMFSGFYPRIHDRKLPPAQALGDYFATYVQRDLRELLNVPDLAMFENFVRLCAGRTSQLSIFRIWRRTWVSRIPRRGAGSPYCRPATWCI